MINENASNEINIIINVDVVIIINLTIVITIINIIIANIIVTNKTVDNKNIIFLTNAVVLFLLPKHCHK